MMFVMLCVENGKRQQVAYIDFAKAFDSVCHNKLIAKLKMYVIGGSLLQWIEDFLSGRSHQTKVGNNLSEVAFIMALFKEAALAPCCFYCISMTYLVSLMT